MKNVEYQKRIDGRLVNRSYLSEEDASAIDQQLVQRELPAPSHGNSKGVVIIDIDEAVYEQRMEKNKAQPIVNHYFHSAIEASLHFGYVWDAVGQALRRARKRGESSATVGGVTVSWADETPGMD